MCQRAALKAVSQGCQTQRGFGWEESPAVFWLQLRV